MEGEPTVWELARRMNALESEQRDMRELVDGVESWSHRCRLQRLEDDRRDRDAIRDYQRLRNSRRGRAREWGSFALAAAAIVLAAVHGGGMP